MPGDYINYRSALLAALTAQGFPLERHQPLAHPLILTNFTMSMAVPLLPERQKERIREGGDFCVVQPCIRIHDSEDFREEDDWWHLTFFEMIGAVIGGKGHRATAAKAMLRLLSDTTGLPRESIHFEYFAGSDERGLPEDAEMREILAGLGVPAANITSSREQFFFSPSHEQAAGPMVEVFCLMDGKRLEIGTFATISYYYDDQQRLDKLSESFTEFGLGIERTSCVAQGRRNLDDSSPMSDLLGLVPALERTARRLFADRLRAAYMLLSEGLRPRAKSREKILRHWMRDAGKALTGLGPAERLATLLACLRKIHGVYASTYGLLDPEAALPLLQAEFERYDWWGPDLR